MSGPAAARCCRVFSQCENHIALICEFKQEGDLEKDAPTSIGDFLAFSSAVFSAGVLRRAFTSVWIDRSRWPRQPRLSRKGYLKGLSRGFKGLSPILVSPSRRRARTHTAGWHGSTTQRLAQALAHARTLKGEGERTQLNSRRKHGHNWHTRRCLATPTKLGGKTWRQKRFL